MNLPSGTQIIPHDVSVKAAGGRSVTVNVTIQGNVIGNREYTEQVGEYVGRKVLARSATHKEVRCVYKIIISVNNNEEVWTLPHCPPDFPIPQPEQHHETYEGLSRDYRRIGTLGLRHMEWTALLPVRRYSFMPSEASADGWAYVDFLSRWRDKKVPFRLIVLDSKGAARLNMPVTVDSFDVTVRKNGDLEYSIAVTEYRFIK